MDHREARAALLGSLDEQQGRAANHISGHAVIAGVPGAGKTRTALGLLATRLDEGLDEDRFLALSFTREAAGELSKRTLPLLASRNLSSGGRKLVSTIHSFAYTLVRSDGELRSLLRFSEIDTRGHLRLALKRLLGELSRKDKSFKGYDLDQIWSFIEHAKMAGMGSVYGDPLGTNTLLAEGLWQHCGLWEERACLSRRQLLQTYEGYEEARAQSGLFTFDDMLCWGWLALVSDRARRDRVRAHYDLVICDEVQDSCAVQWDLTRILCGIESIILSPSGTEEIDGLATLQVDPSLVPIPQEEEAPADLIVLGDSSQSVYKWRGAVPEYLLAFAGREDVSVYQLQNNYRSQPDICDVCTEIVSGRPWHISGAIKPARGAGATPQLALMRAATPEDEAESAITLIMQHLVDGGNVSALDCPEKIGELDWRQAAVLARAGIALDRCELVCARYGIPYRRLGGGTSWLASPQARDLLGYIRVACGLDPTYASLRRIINKPFRFIGRDWLDTCYRESTTKHMLEAVVANIPGLKSHPQRKAMVEFVELIKDLNRAYVAAEQFAASEGATRGILAESDTEAKAVDRQPGPAQMLQMILYRTQYVRRLKEEEGGGFSRERLHIISEILRIARWFRSPLEYLSYLEQLQQVAAREGKSKKDNDANALTLSTVHSAKGLEWPYVHVVDVAEKRFPHGNSDDLQEELRLLYVAISRAKDRCVLSASGEPSAFWGLVASIAARQDLTVDRYDIRPTQEDECPDKTQSAQNASASHASAKEQQPSGPSSGALPPPEAQSKRRRRRGKRKAS